MTRRLLIRRMKKILEKEKDTGKKLRKGMKNWKKCWYGSSGMIENDMIEENNSIEDTRREE